MLRSVELSDYMLRRPITVFPGMTVHEAARRILEYKVSGVIVVDEHQTLLGMLSELDCLRVILSSMYNDEEFAHIPVADVMTVNIEVQNPHDDIVDVATSMLDHKHRRRPVVSGGKLIGQVSCRQILRVVTETGLKKRKL
ncbi:MAG: CBS domain-containing protein [SAR86 cluster bacterium]|jgi:CBS domain-containing protein|uniref:CBS domain-containing protein n=1 Tax=SAR86 cluster bacterium TaxID=2030880 RepID=A0A973A985_9GAMM|nr:CBS domain-containing protein [SAR86 cluster bacterium]